MAGLGDGAFYIIQDAVLTLIFAKGNWCATLDVFTSGKPNVDAALKLGKILFGRMT